MKLKISEDEMSQIKYAIEQAIDTASYYWVAEVNYHNYTPQRLGELEFEKNRAKAKLDVLIEKYFTT